MKYIEAVIKKFIYEESEDKNLKVIIEGINNYILNGKNYSAIKTIHSNYNIFISSKEIDDKEFILEKADIEYSFNQNLKYILEKSFINRNSILIGINDNNCIINIAIQGDK